MRALLIGLSLTTLLCGCGIKPSQVKMPEGSDAPYFPQEYPNTQHDPQPDTTQTESTE